MTDKPSHSRYRRALREEAERERRLALFDEMLEALREAHQVIGLEHTLRPDYGWLEWLDEKITPVIAKAEGKS